MERFALLAASMTLIDLYTFFCRQDFQCVNWSSYLVGDEFRKPVWASYLLNELTMQVGPDRPHSPDFTWFSYTDYITSTRISQFCAMAEHAVIVKLSPLCSGEPVGALPGISCRSPIIHAIMLCQWRTSKLLYTKQLRCCTVKWELISKRCTSRHR